MLQPMVNTMIRGLGPKMIFVIEDDKCSVKAVKDRLRKEDKKFYIVRPIDYFIDNPKQAL